MADGEANVSIVDPVALTEGDVDAAAGVLARAFADDAGAAFVFPDLVERARLGPVLARATVRYGLRCGAPLVRAGTAGGVRGVALWFPPEAPEPTGAELAETGLAAVPGLMGAAAWGRFTRILEPLDALHPRYAPDPHWYLALLGVDPGHQRQGIGDALMRPVFAMADRDGVPCYLESPTAENTAYYERRGFRTVGETEIPEAGIRVWLLRREPMG